MSLESRLEFATRGDQGNERIMVLANTVRTCATLTATKSMLCFAVTSSMNRSSTESLQSKSAIFRGTATALACVRALRSIECDELVAQAIMEPSAERKRTDALMGYRQQGDATYAVDTPYK